MDIFYKSSKAEKMFNSLSTLAKEHGHKRAVAIMLRQEQISNAINLFEFANIHPKPRCHELEKRKKVDRKGCFGVDLDGAWRLIIEPCDDPLPLDNNKKLIWNKICAIRILGVEDYHG